MNKEQKLLAKAKSKCTGNGDRYIALRDTTSEDKNTSYYSKNHAEFGGMFDYCEIRDVVYNRGRGCYVLYEKGVWFDGEIEDNTPQYEIY